MIRVPESRLLLGTSEDLKDIRTVLGEGISAIIDLGIEEPVPLLPRATNYCRLTLSDDGENDPATVAAAIRMAATFLAGDHDVLICCHAGLSRSPSVAAAALAITRGQSASHALCMLGGLKRTDVSAAFWNQVVTVLSTMS